MTPQESIVAVGRSWIGTPYILQGRIKGVAADCVGHIDMSGKELGFIPLTYVAPPYRADIAGSALLKECDKIMDRIHVLELGAVVAMRFKDRNLPQHLAIVGNYKHGGWSIIQALDTLDRKGRVVEHRLDKGTEQRICAIYRMRWNS